MKKINRKAVQDEDDPNDAPVSAEVQEAIDAAFDEDWLADAKKKNHEREDKAEKIKGWAEE